MVKILKGLFNRELIIVSLILLSYIVSKLWTRLPEDDTLCKNLFPYYKGEHGHMPYRTYIWILNELISRAILIAAFYVLIKRFILLFTFLFILYALDIPDFLLIFGEPFMYLNLNLNINLKNTPIEFGLIKGIFMVLIWSIILAKSLFQQNAST